MASVGLSLPGIVLMGGGLVLAYAGLNDPDGGPIGVVQAVLKGKMPEPGPQKTTPVSTAGAAAGAALAGVAKSISGLGAVQPHVKKAAEHFGARFGIDDIGGFRSKGSVPNSDHPRGLALDFMVSAKTDKARGDALAAALLAGRQQWGVTYVIWNRRINSGDGRGWRPYFGPSAHTDHVHASFKPKG